MTHHILLDAAQTLALPLTGINLIEASAGTGKTYTIANLYLRLLLEGRPAREILVVSFTNAATDELRQRIHARLYQALQALTITAETTDDFLAQLQQRYRCLPAAAQQTWIERLRLALRSLDEAMITTIHGFCHAVLADHAWLIRHRFDCEVCADDSADWEQAVKDWWRATSYPLPAPQWALLRRAVPRLADLIAWQQLLRQHPQDRLLPEVVQSLTELLAQHTDFDPEADDAAQRLCQIKTRALFEADAYASRQVAALKQAQGRMAYQDQLDLLRAALSRDGGELLAQRLRERFPVALIDEFQDTDPVQYDIFKRLYFNAADTGLILIGDPKQAIYGFRGGDIFTYIALKAEPTLRLYALQTNWRSQPGLVAAVNQLFTLRPAAFIFEQAIGFTPAQAAARNRDASLCRAGAADAALSLWQLPLRENGKTFSVSEIRGRINYSVAAEIDSLLDPRNRVEFRGRPLTSGDIAILVRDRDEGEALRKVLLERGLRAVSIGREKVFASSEAQALYLLLDGIVHCADDISLRRAHASGLLGLGYDELAAAFDDDQLWQQWIESMQGLHTTWVNNGFIAMFESMQRALDLGALLARRPHAERRLTNLAHLAELLQQQSRLRPGMDALMAWYRRQMADGGGDEAELRLESDAALIKIVTIHKSKGLEYPVVFVPFMWRCRRAGKGPIRFHDHAQRASLDLGSDAAHLPLAERERLAEDLRLLYVALTRAKAKLYLAWGDVGDGRSQGQPKHTALAYLLHSRQTPQDLAKALPAGFTDAGVIDVDLQSLAQSCETIEVVALPGDNGPPALPPSSAAVTEGKPKRFQRKLGIWRINSFSTLTRDLHAPSQRDVVPEAGDAILNFPAGSDTGLLLHQLLEHLDFQREIGPQSHALIARLAPAYGISDQSHQQTLDDWLRFIVATEFDTTGLRLTEIAWRQRLNELKFDFAVDRLDVAALNRLLQQTTEAPLAPLGEINFRGLLTGIIDLVFEFRGKYYLADYKSNFLGTRLEDYAAPRLEQAMYARRYDLQALLYSLALHRYLEQRLRGYHYEQHFGGCYYLFLRALRPATGPRYGVHFERPAAAQLKAVEQLFAFTPTGYG